MKKVKIQVLKIYAVTISFSCLLFFSCNNTKKKTDEIEEEVIEEVSKIKTKKDNVVVDSNHPIKSRTYKMKDGKALVYYLDANGIAGFNDWIDYTIVNTELASIRSTNPKKSTKKRLQNLNFRIANLANTIPDWLKTADVIEDVVDIQKEYKNLIDDVDVSEEEMKENLEDFTEKFDDLKVELDQTIQEYAKIHVDAIEEFNEAYDDGNIKKAIKEYNEEINKLDKIIDNQ
ncbi:hypothetical protein [Polaribacter sp.]|uniref:hypothetical protein n=1 Tax=Polaribacter sp. TaxID=1920175 RepID=UPI003F6B202C